MTGETAVILTLLVGTSALLYALGRVAGLPPGGLPSAAVAAMECCGAIAFCLVLNVGVGGAAIVTLRALTPWFVPLYVLGDVSITIVSVLQGIALWCWRTTRRR